MPEQTIKINITYISGRPIYHAITLDYKPVDIKDLSLSQKEDLIKALGDTQDAIIATIDI